MLDRLHALETFGIKLGLENIRRLCAGLGHPERSFLSLHIAGTNGKGSVSAMAHAALVAAGLRAARYTSPHLVELRERFVIGEQPATAETLDAVGTEVLDTAERLVADGELAAPPTFFEATTAIAFELFRRAHVDVAVVEVGLGGRFDATNIVAAPAGAITSIALDHQEHLGDTLAAIAWEKAGIIKPGMRVVTGDLPPQAVTVIEAVARDQGATLARNDAKVEATLVDGRGLVTIRTDGGVYGPVTLALRGAHQVANAVVAVRLLEQARACGLPVPVAAIERGLAGAEWPARLELMTLAGGQRVLLDAAHNVEGAQALAAYLSRWHPERPPLVIGVMWDKDADGILRTLLPVTSAVVTTTAGGQRAMAAGELGRRASAIEPGRRVDVEPDPRTAIDRAFEHGALVCVAGSIYLAGRVRDDLERRAILY